MIDDVLSVWFGSSWLEYIAAATGLIAVILTIRRSVWYYLFGIPSVIIYTYLFYQWQLYSETLLYAYYFVMLCLGLRWWLRGREASGLVAIVATPLREGLALIVGVVAGTAALGGFMATQTDADLPWLDATTTVMALAGQYLQSARRLETYAVWAVVNILSIAMFSLKGKEPTMWLYAIFLALSFVGMIAWWRAWRARRAEG